MNELMLLLKAYDWGGDRGSLKGIDELIAAAQGDATKLADVEQALIDVLQSDVKLAAVDYTCRQLALIGTARCVPVLAGMLTNAELSDRALYALEVIPDASVNIALRAALPTTSGIQQVGIVNTLGERGDKEAVTVLSEMQNSSDKVLSNAVKTALEKITRTA